MSFILYLVPNPALPDLNPWLWPALVSTVRDVCKRNKIDLGVADYLAHVPAENVTLVLFSAGRCHAESPPTAAGLSDYWGAQKQDGHSMYPIWLYCDRITRWLKDKSVIVSQFVRAIFHEAGHHYLGMTHSRAGPKDVMNDNLGLGSWDFSEEYLKRARLYFR